MRHGREEDELMLINQQSASAQQSAISISKYQRNSHFSFPGFGVCCFADRCGTSPGYFGWPLFVVVVDSSSIRCSEPQVRCCASHRRSARRLVPRRPTAADGRGQRFVYVIDTPAESSCLRYWSCFEFPIQSGLGSVLRVASYSSP